MRLFAQILLVLWLLAPLAEAKIIAGDSSCLGFYANLARLLRVGPRPEPFPFQLGALEAAIDPKHKLGGHRGKVNGGLWRYSEGGRDYFVKSLGSGTGYARDEFENAKAMARIGIGPKVHSFRDDNNVDYLIFDFVPGVNAKSFNLNGNGLNPPLQVPPEVAVEIRRSLGLAQSASWAEAEELYFAELFARRFELAKRLKEIREKLLAEDYKHLNDFQFMVHFEKGKPGIEVQVIDTSFFQRGASPGEPANFEPLDIWVQILENWHRPEKSAGNPQLENMIEANAFPAEHH